MNKYRYAYILTHNGLGDSINIIGAVNFFLLHYDKVYLLVKDKYESNVKLLINNKNVILIPFDHHDEYNNCKKIINSVYNNSFTDIFISGKHTKYLKSKIKNPAILNYVQTDKYKVPWPHIKKIYRHLKLDLRIYYNYFDINSSQDSIAQYQKIKNLKIIFCHTQASNKLIKLPTYIKKYTKLSDYIIICTNKNEYNTSDLHYNLANQFINLPVQFYIDIIKNACIIFTIDSCFSAIVNPLRKNHKLNTDKINFYIRK